MLPRTAVHSFSTADSRLDFSPRLCALSAPLSTPLAGWLTGNRTRGVFPIYSPKNERIRPGIKKGRAEEGSPARRVATIRRQSKVYGMLTLPDTAQAELPTELRARTSKRYVPEAGFVVLV